MMYDRLKTNSMSILLCSTFFLGVGTFACKPVPGRDSFVQNVDSVNAGGKGMCARFQLTSCVEKSFGPDITNIIGYYGTVESRITETKGGNGVSQYLFYETWLENVAAKDGKQVGCSVLAEGPSNIGVNPKGDPLANGRPLSLRVAWDPRFKLLTKCPLLENLIP